MTVPKDNEKRKHSRVEFATSIRVFLEVDGKAVEVEGNSKDLSLKGIFVDTSEPFSVGTTCEIKVCLTGGVDKIELPMKGRIVRVTEAGIGIEFDSMDVDTYSHLKNIVYYNSIDHSD